MQKAAAVMQISEIASARSSSRSAPETRSLDSPHCQMQRPAAAPSAPSVTTVTKIRWPRPASPASSAKTSPAVSAMIGEMPA